METRREQVLWCAWRPARSNTPNSCWLAMPLALVSGARATAPAAYARYMHSPRGSSTRETRLRTRNVTFAMLMRVSPSQAFTATAECRHRPHGAWQHWLMRSPLPYIQATLCKLLGGHALAWLSTALALCVQLSCVRVCCTCSHGESICVGPTTSSSSIDGGAAFFWASSSGMRPARADEAAGDARAARGDIGPAGPPSRCSAWLRDTGRRRWWMAARSATEPIALWAGPGPWAAACSRLAGGRAIWEV
jgi:hypothetical protein